MEISEKSSARIFVATVPDFVDTLRDALEAGFPGRVDIVTTLKGMRGLLDRRAEDYRVAVIDSRLVGGDDALIDLFVAENLPAIILTDEIGAEHGGHLPEEGIIDYVDRNVPFCLTYVERLLHRILGNYDSKALVVDDSATFRSLVRALLAFHCFDVLEAEDGEQALEVMEQNPDIRLAIIDHIMPGMDGFTLVTLLRAAHEAKDLAIVGVSASDQEGLGISFIKFGADEFISKPLIPQEFMARVNDCMNKQDMLRELKARATTDFLTRLYNRHHFFDTAHPLYASAKRGTVTLAAAMIDIDFFKQVNDAHGHRAGDEVLRVVADQLKTRARETDLVARMGGEEFCYLAVNPAPDHIESLFEALRQVVDDQRIDVGSGVVHVTTSIGVCTSVEGSLDEMLHKADEALYQAKESGRNRVVILHPEKP